jgi:Copper binding proteins, plastocyanin/azurin family
MVRWLALIAMTGGAAFAGASALAAPSSTPLPQLIGTTGPDPVITLKRAGKRVTRLKPGKYRITVYDRETVHDFRIRGPRMQKTITTLFFTGRKTVTVALTRRGRYTYYCDPHEFGGMQGSFTVR